MQNTYTAVIKKTKNWWIGWIEEIPGVNCQEKTREELLRSMQLTLAEAIELNRRDALASAVSDYREEKGPLFPDITRSTTCW